MNVVRLKGMAKSWCCVKGEVSPFSLLMINDIFKLHRSTSMWLTLQRQETMQFQTNNSHKSIPEFTVIFLLMWRFRILDILQNLVGVLFSCRWIGRLWPYLTIKRIRIQCMFIGNILNYPNYPAMLGAMRKAITNAKMFENVDL